MNQIIQGKHLGGVTIVDMKTGKEEKGTGRMMMLPAKPGTCEWCAVDHPKDYPHDATSLFYQYRFYNENNRWPGWNDALAHCDVNMKAHWLEHLTDQGIDVEGGQVHAPKKGKKR